MAEQDQQEPTKEDKFTRRNFFGKAVKWAARGVFAGLAADTFNRQVTGRIIEGKKREDLIADLEQETKRRFPVVENKGPGGEPVVIGYDDQDQPIMIKYEEGEALVDYYKKYWGFKDEYLDEPRVFNIKDKDGNSAPSRKPDGKLWTQRERIHERPDLYYDQLIGYINQENIRKGGSWVYQQLPPEEGLWGMRDFVEAGLLTLMALIVRRRMQNSESAAKPTGYVSELLRQFYEAKKANNEFIRERELQKNDPIEIPIDREYNRDGLIKSYQSAATESEFRKLDRYVLERYDLTEALNLFKDIFLQLPPRDLTQSDGIYQRPQEALEVLDYLLIKRAVKENAVHLSQDEKQALDEFFKSMLKPYQQIVKQFHTRYGNPADNKFTYWLRDLFFNHQDMLYDTGGGFIARVLVSCDSSHSFSMVSDIIEYLSPMQAGVASFGAYREQFKDAEHGYTESGNYYDFRYNIEEELIKALRSVSDSISAARDGELDEKEKFMVVSLLSVHDMMMRQVFRKGGVTGIYEQSGIFKKHPWLKEKILSQNPLAEEIELPGRKVSWTKKGNPLTDPSFVDLKPGDISQSRQN